MELPDFFWLRWERIGALPDVRAPLVEVDFLPIPRRDNDDKYFCAHHLQRPQLDVRSRRNAVPHGILKRLVEALACNICPDNPTTVVDAIEDHPPGTCIKEGRHLLR